MKKTLTLFTLFGLFTIGAKADPVRCNEYKSFLNKNIITEYCSFTGMEGYNQLDIPSSYKGRPVNPETACGPTAIASIYKHINNNKDYYNPKPNTFFTDVVGKDVQSELIPELFLKMDTKLNYGTIPYWVYTQGLAAKYFDNSFTEFYSFYESSVFNDGTDKYYEKVKRRNPMAVLLGYFTPACADILGTKQCSLIAPDTLHYEAVSGATKRLDTTNNTTSYAIQLWQGNGHNSGETTALTQVSGGCKREKTISICTSYALNWSWKSWSFTSSCKSQASTVVCGLRYILPVSKGMRFTTDDTNIENTNAQWTFMLGYFGLNKK